MSVSAAHASAFYREVIANGEVWTLKDENGFPAPRNSEGKRAMPFWSLRSRAERIIENVPAYQGFQAIGLPLEEWRTRWLPGLAKDDTLVGLNWSGGSATGYDLPPTDVEAALATLG